MIVKRFAAKIRRRLLQATPSQQIRRYVGSGRLPWTPGYLPYRDATIRASIGGSDAAQAFRSGALSGSYGEFLDERVVELPWLVSRLTPCEGRRLLDAGSSLNFSWLLSHDRFRERRITIATLAPESEASWRDSVSYQFCDLRDLPFKADLFDEVACISTLEHIGMDNTIYTNDDTYNEAKRDDHLNAVREIRRVLKPGGVAFISVPYGRPVDFGWYQQFDAGMIGRLIEAFAPSHLEETYFRYDGGWQFAGPADCADAVGFDVHRTKYFDPTSDRDYDPDHAAASRAIAALRLVK